MEDTSLALFIGLAFGVGLTIFIQELLFDMKKQKEQSTPISQKPLVSLEEGAELGVGA